MTKFGMALIQSFGIGGSHLVKSWIHWWPYALELL